MAGQCPQPGRLRYWLLGSDACDTPHSASRLLARGLAEGELGTTVLKYDLFDALARLIAMPKPDLDALTQAVRARSVNAKAL